MIAVMAHAEAVLRLPANSATQVFGSPEDVKLRSCATLFAVVSPAGSVFERLLAHHFGGIADAATLRLLEHGRSRGLDRPR